MAGLATVDVAPRTSIVVPTGSSNRRIITINPADLLTLQGMTYSALALRSKRVVDQLTEPLEMGKTEQELWPTAKNCYLNPEISTILIFTTSTRWAKVHGDGSQDKSEELFFTLNK